MTRNLETKTNEELHTDVYESVSVLQNELKRLERLKEETRVIRSYANELARRYRMTEGTTDIKCISIDTDAGKETVNINAEGGSILINVDAEVGSIDLEENENEKSIIIDIDAGLDSIEFDTDAVIEPIDLDADTKAQAEQLFEEMQIEDDR
jgi:hypothetical protein